jgi:peptidoglycan/xylan/chitin deacetylase (PgdA/CDA1 family)
MKVIEKLKRVPLEMFGWTYEALRVKRFAAVFPPITEHLRILCYHDVHERDLPSFERQIQFFKNEFAVITAEQLKAFFLGRARLPDINVFLTFDDGSADQYKAAEVLDRQQVQACFFVSTGDRDKDFINARPGSRLPPMTWDQIKDLRRRGHIIGSHTVTHPILSSLKPAEIAGELVHSKMVLETLLGENIEFFAFPFGTRKEVNREVLLLAKKYYEFNFLFLSVKNHFFDANRFLINRTVIGPRDSLCSLRAVMAGMKDWPKTTERRKLQQLLF